MATSAFKSTTQRDSVGVGGGGSSGGLRRSRSVSRFSGRPEAKAAPRPGEAAQFPEISLDDLALEFFSSSSSWNENGSDGGGAAAERQGRSVSRRGEIGRWASDTASSRRKSRSVSRTREEASSRPAPAVVRERNVSSSGAAPRRRRSLSVARHHISDSESEANHFPNSNNHAKPKAPTSGNAHLASVPNVTASSNRRLRRTHSYKDLLILNDGYSSHSSAVTDDESKDTHLGRNGYEKIIRPVYSQKKREPPAGDVGSGGLYEAMRQELRYAVEEIRTELNQAMGRNHTGRAGGRSSQLDDSETVRDLSGRLKTLPDSRTLSVVEKPSRARKKSSDKHRMSRRLTEEAEKYLEDFISNVEDTDISSFDGERSDGSSTLGGTTRGPKDPVIRVAETYKSFTASNSSPGEMDDVIFPWLQWETSHDGSPSADAKIRTPVTPKALKWSPEMETTPSPDLANYTASSQGSWSPAFFNSRDTKEDACETWKIGDDRTSSYLSEVYLDLKKNEELLFEVYRERNGIKSGRLLLCTGVL